MTSVASDEAAGAPVAAILMFVAGLFLAATNGAIMKQLTDTLPTVTIIWGRYAVYLLIMLPFALPVYGRSILRPPDMSLQLIRVTLMLVGTWCFVTGVADLVYADAIAILYVYPFVIIALSPLFLGERVSRAAWLCVATGFAGVLTVMRPSLDITGIPALFVLAAGIFLGGHLVATRLLVRAKSPLITSTYTALIITAVTSVVVPFEWQGLSGHQIALVIAMGTVSAASQYLMLMAFSRAPAPVLAPFSYSEIPGAAVIGIIAFSEMPDAIAWFGIAVIVTSGVIIAKLSGSKAQPPRPRQPVP